MWILLLLIRYFSFFRETTTLLDVEGWDFLSFLAFIIGPIVLLFATNLLIAAPDAQGDATLDASYFALSSRFFCNAGAGPGMGYRSGRGLWPAPEACSIRAPDRADEQPLLRVL